MIITIWSILSTKLVKLIVNSSFQLKNNNNTIILLLKSEYSVMLYITNITKKVMGLFMRKKVTIQEIADTVGLSKYAVSRALAGKSGVSAETRQLIVQTAEQLGYFASKSLIKTIHVPANIDNTDWKGTILILFPNIRYQNTDSLYWGPIFNGISTSLNQQGVNILTLTEPSNDSIFTLLNPGAIQGIISVGSISTSLLLELKRSQIPVVMVDHIDPQFECDTIFSDNTTSIVNMMDELVAFGYTNYQFIGNIHEAHSFKQRWLAFRNTLDEHQIALQQDQRLLSIEVEEMQHVIPKFIEEHGLPHVFVCANDSYAQFTIEVLERNGIQVPKHCSVTGFDFTNPDLPLLATVNVSKEMLGKRSVDQLIWRMQHQYAPHERKLICTKLILNKHFAFPLA